MPTGIVPYIRGLIQGHRVTATFLAYQFSLSHDQVTRALHRKFAWQKLVLLIIRRLFGSLTGGYLLVDDTVIAKPYAKYLEGASFVYSSLLNKSVYGYHVVLLCWTNGQVTLPLSWRWYRKGGKTKVELAQELLQEAHNRWKLKPQAVLFDSWYAADKIITQIAS